MECITRRQTQSSVETTVLNQVRPLAISKGMCRYGFPQVLVQYPVNTERKTVHTGILRLTCPHLVKEIDKIENEGGLESYNKIVRNSPKLTQSFLDVHCEWRDIIHSSVTPSERDFISEKLGRQGSESFFSSGILGITNNKVNDVKCLHAHTADYLLRGRNLIGKLVLDHLKSQSIDPSGCEGCHHQCNINIPKSEASWWHTPKKNRAKLISKRINRAKDKKEAHLNRQRRKFIDDELNASRPGNSSAL